MKQLSFFESKKKWYSIELCTFAALLSRIMYTERLYQAFSEHPLVTTDSRDCPEGAVFFALKGASFNGNRFAKMALEKGCSYAVIDEPGYAEDDRYIVVPDTLKALQALARHHRRQFDIPVIGITGTNGKTTTKELVAAVLSKKYHILYTQGNFNNDIGVPKTLLQLDRSHQLAVVEMGASHPGDIKTLVEIVEPSYGLITNVGRAHLQGFGSFEGVVKTKGELYDFLRSRQESLLFVNSDNEILMALAEGMRQVTYGTEAAASPKVLGRVDHCAPLLHFSWKTEGGTWQEVQTQLIGSYNILNMLAAISIGLHFGVSETQINQALSDYTPTNNRSQLEETANNHLIIDAYNANPTSMAAALDNFQLMEVGPKMAILGDMKELGAVSSEEHQKVVDRIAAHPFGEVWLVGEEFKKTTTDCRTFNNVEEVKEALALHPRHNHYILIKGSNSMRLSELKGCL